MAWISLGLSYFVFTQLPKSLRNLSFTKSGHFSAIISLNTFKISHSCPSPSRILMMQMLDLSLLSHRSLRLCSFFFFSLSSHCCSDWMSSFDLSSSSLILPFCHLRPSTESIQRVLNFSSFFFHLCNSTSLFLLLLFYFAEILHFFICFQWICNYLWRQF